jgi:hypothetical protein
MQFESKGHVAPSLASAVPDVADVAHLFPSPPTSTLSFLVRWPSVYNTEITRTYTVFLVRNNGFQGCRRRCGMSKFA